jgi:tetratricopeptide (TPR) repeat protein
LKPEEKGAYRWLGRIYQKTGRLNEATAAFQRILEIDPEDKTAFQFFAEQGSDANQTQSQ